MSFIRFGAKNHPQQTKKRGPDDSVDDRWTPADIFDPLHAEIHFTLDAAASKDNALLPKFYDRAADGLRESWRGERVWCNPPYSNLRDWVEKAMLETSTGCEIAALLLPANRTEQGWWQEHIEPGRDRGGRVKTRFLARRRRFGWPRTRVVPPKGDRPPFGLVIVIVEPA